MAQKSFPFNSIGGDRKYKAEDFREYFRQFIGNGVFYANADALKVKAAGGMQAAVCIGGAWIDGVGYINTTSYNVTLETADGALARIDRIVLRCDFSERKTGISVKKGSYSAQPVAVALQRDADAYELALADVYIGRGVIEITQANITDLRLNKSLCGIVTGLIEQADTTEIFNQFETYLKEFKQAYTESFSEWTKEKEDELIQWANETRGGLETWITQTEAEFNQWKINTAGGLLDWINQSKKDFTEWQQDEQAAMELWESQRKAQFTQWQDGEKAAFKAWQNIEQMDFTDWLNNLKALLDETAAGKLQNEIEALQEAQFDKYYGLVAQKTEFIDDNNIKTTNAEAVIHTQFVYDAEGNETAVTTVIPNGKNYSYVKTTTFYENSVESTVERRIAGDGI